STDSLSLHDALPIFILKIGEWVLREACRWATFIGAERGLQVSVNLSPRQFNDPKLVQLVAKALRDSGLPARLLELEITESTAMQDRKSTRLNSSHGS